LSARHLPALTLVAAVLVFGTALAMSSSDVSEGAASASRTVATATTSDFRVVVVARKLGGGSAPEARVTVRTFERRSADWRATGVHTLAERYFWNTLTRPRVVCRLEMRTTGGRSKPTAVVQLLQSPSLGCGPASTYGLR
jgi:hypothetical protein